MATYRIGIGSFNLKDGAVGIGTESSGLGNLKVEGTVKTTDLDTTSGIATFTRYAGFAVDNLEIGKDSRDRTLTGEHFTTGDIVVGVNSTFTVSVGATVDVGTVPSVSIGTHFSPPTGGVDDRPEVPVEGTVRFNKDLNTLEFYNGVDWRQFTVSGASGRAVICQGYYYPGSAVYPGRYEYISIPTKGNALDFGSQISGAARDRNACGSNTRGIYSGGLSPGGGKYNEIEYITLASQGDGIDFGDLTAGNGHGISCSSQTRGIFAGGYRPASSNVIDYVEIGTLGNAIDFGDSTLATGYPAGAGSGIRGFILGGSYNSPNDLASDKIDYVTFASKGNATDFGNLSAGRWRPAATGNSVSILTSGSNDGAASDKGKSIDKTNSMSLGNAIEFGQLTIGRGMHFGTANQTRAVFGSGASSPNFSVNSMDYINIQTGGSAEDFGDVDNIGTAMANATSDSHGGLGGY